MEKDQINQVKKKEALKKASSNEENEKVPLAKVSSHPEPIMVSVEVHDDEETEDHLGMTSSFEGQFVIPTSRPGTVFCEESTPGKGVWFRASVECDLTPGVPAGYRIIESGQRQVRELAVEFGDAAFQDLGGFDLIAQRQVEPRQLRQRAAEQHSIFLQIPTRSPRPLDVAVC